MAPVPRRTVTRLPSRILYATSAPPKAGSPGEIAYESVRAAYQAGILGRVIAYWGWKHETPRWPLKSLRWHPVQLLSCLGDARFQGAKSKCLDATAARFLARRKYDLFHGWSGECVKSLRAARRLGIPTVLEIPTWHRGNARALDEENPQQQARGFKRWLDSLRAGREQALEEYDLADLILVLSERAAQSFLAAGIEREKLFLFSRGVDTERFTPLKQPPVFRALFAGPLLVRKGVHHLLEAWHQLNLDNAELVLAGPVADEIKPYLSAYGSGNIKLAGDVETTAQLYQQCSVHIFPSVCEGSARVTYEAASCGLPQITTREAGDAVIDGLNGLIVPCENVDALAAAIAKLHGDARLRAQMGEAARKRVVENFTWDRFRERLLDAYRAALARSAR